jgi:hypothetical protein
MSLPMESLLEQLKDIAHRPIDANGGLDHLGYFWDAEYRNNLADDASRTLYGITKDVSLIYEGPYKKDDCETSVTWIKGKPGNLKARLEKECGGDWSTVTYVSVVYYSDTKIENVKGSGEFTHTIEDNMQALQDLLEKEPKNDMKILVQKPQWRTPANQYRGPFFGPRFYNPSTLY